MRREEQETAGEGEGSDGPKMAQDAAKTASESPLCGAKMAEEHSRRAQDGLKTAQDSAKMPREVPKRTLLGQTSGHTQRKRIFLKIHFMVLAAGTTAE